MIYPQEKSLFLFWLQVSELQWDLFVNTHVWTYLTTKTAEKFMPERLVAVPLGGKRNSLMVVAFIVLDVITIASYWRKVEWTRIVLSQVLKPILLYRFLFSVQRLPLNKYSSLPLRASANYRGFVRTFSKNEKSKKALVWLSISSGAIVKRLRWTEVVERVVDWSQFRDWVTFWYCRSF